MATKGLFKAGDKVKIVFTDVNKGKIGEYLETSSNSYILETSSNSHIVEIDGVIWKYAYDSSLELVKEPKFKIGDKVKYIGNSQGIPYGIIGVIDLITGSNTAHVDTGNWEYNFGAFLHNLELIEEEDDYFDTLVQQLKQKILSNQEKTIQPIIPLVTEEYKDASQVDSPKHYQILPNVEVRDIANTIADRLAEAGYSGGFISDYVQMLQYLLRFDQKGQDLQDLEKAKKYLDWIILELQANKYE